MKEVEPRRDPPAPLPLLIASLHDGNSIERQSQTRGDTLPSLLRLHLHHSAAGLLLLSWLTRSPTLTCTLDEGACVSGKGSRGAEFRLHVGQQWVRSQPPGCQCSGAAGLQGCTERLLQAAARTCLLEILFACFFCCLATDCQASHFKTAYRNILR